MKKIAAGILILTVLGSGKAYAGVLGEINDLANWSIMERARALEEKAEADYQEAAKMFDGTAKNGGKGAVLALNQAIKRDQNDSLPKSLGKRILSPIVIPPAMVAAGIRMQTANREERKPSALKSVLVWLTALLSAPAFLVYGAIKGVLFGLPNGGVSRTTSNFLFPPDENWKKGAVPGLFEE